MAEQSALFTQRVPVDDQVDALWNYVKDRPRGFTIAPAVMEEITGFKNGTYGFVKCRKKLQQRLLEERQILLRYVHVNKVWQLCTSEDQLTQAQKHKEKGERHEEEALKIASLIDPDKLAKESQSVQTLFIAQTARRVEQSRVDRKERKALLTKTESLPKRIR